MSKENQNKDQQDNTEKKKEAENNTPVTPVSSSPPFPEPKVLNAVVDPKEKPKEGPTPFSFTSPQAVHADMINPTKGDAAPPVEKKPTIEEVRAQIIKDETAKDDATYDDYYDNADMIIDMWEVGLSSFCNFFASDTSVSAYEYPKPKSEKLKRQLTKILIKHKKMIPIEYMFAGTAIGATAPILIKTSDRRKLVNAQKDKEKKEKKEIANTDKKPDPLKRRNHRPSKT